tara:strand:+ start:1007 stop:1168 length:162 start_codon:yes stop_codon:yes gene_type:complete
MAFVPKCSLIALLLTDCLVQIAVCGEAAFAVALGNMGSLILGASVAHMAELVR